ETPGASRLTKSTSRLREMMGIPPLDWHPTTLEV
ncbi:MAG: hypothetical protein ACI814_001075, partial [Mariniblastus sp.]